MFLCILGHNYSYEETGYWDNIGDWHWTRIHTCQNCGKMKVTKGIRSYSMYGG